MEGKALANNNGSNYKEMLRRVFNKKTAPFWLLAPTFIYYLVFWFSPIFISIKEVFTTLDGKFTVLGNFLFLFEQETFLPALLNTAFFAVASVMLQFVIALVLAILLNRKFKGQKLILFLVMIPMAITPTAVAIVWKTGLISSGWINSILQSFSVLEERIPFLGLRGIEAVIMIILIDTWTVMPSVLIILIAGLGNINEETKEAAYIFGASKWRIIKDITIPLLKPSIITAVILRMIAAVQVWAVVVMVMGFTNVPFLVERIAYYVGPVSSLPYADKLAYTYSFLTAVIVFIATIVYFKISKKGTALDRRTQK
ncbi:MAG: sugar ABC transporter permease [Bacilli bacterium]|nr:sugar ABC transporter permease [Bacilli bacterium]MBN2696390.1 sugar ABC transporter permease [Bacilli bacterium]